MDTTDDNTSNTSTTDKIGFEDGENVKNDEEQTENIISDSPSTSYAGKCIRSKEDKIYLYFGEAIKRYEEYHT